jgi:hypothetical protein
MEALFVPGWMQLEFGLGVLVTWSGEISEK